MRVDPGADSRQVGTCNVFMVKDGVIYTPPLVGGGLPADTILEGVTRDSIIQVGLPTDSHNKPTHAPPPTLACGMTKY